MKKNLTPEQKKKRAKKARIIIIAIVLFITISNAIATKIIYDSIFKRYDGEPRFDTAPYAEIVDSRMEISVAEGDESLKAYFYDAENEKGIIVIAPGLHAGADDYLPMTEYFVEDGWDVFAFDPLGTNGSSGKSTVGFSQEIYDLDAVLDYVEVTYPEEEIYLFGHSRGGFAVCSMMESNHKIKAVCSVSGLNSAMEAVIGLSSRYIGPVANANYFDLWLYQVILFGADTMAKQADDAITDTDIPVIIIQGTEDETAPMDKYSVYSHKDEIDPVDVVYSIRDEEGSNGHTDLMFDEDGVNDELMLEIVTFFEGVE